MNLTLTRQTAPFRKNIPAWYSPWTEVVSVKKSRFTEGRLSLPWSRSNRDRLYLTSAVKPDYPMLLFRLSERNTAGISLLNSYKCGSWKRSFCGWKSCLLTSVPKAMCRMCWQNRAEADPCTNGSGIYMSCSAHAKGSSVFRWDSPAARSGIILLLPGTAQASEHRIPAHYADRRVHVWAMDFVSDVLCSDGDSLCLLTVTDPSPLMPRDLRTAEVTEMLHSIARRHPLSQLQKTDNGSELAGKMMVRWVTDPHYGLNFDLFTQSHRYW